MYKTTASFAAASCCLSIHTSLFIEEELLFLRLPAWTAAAACILNGGVVPVKPVGVPEVRAVCASCVWASKRSSASSNNTNALRARSSIVHKRSSSSASMSLTRTILGRRLAVARAMAVAAVLAEVPMRRIAVFVSARARAPVWRDPGDTPNRAAASWP